MCREHSVKKICKQLLLYFVRSLVVVVGIVMTTIQEENFPSSLKFEININIIY